MPRAIANTTKDGWGISRKRMLTTTKKAAKRETNAIKVDTAKKIRYSPYHFTGMIGLGRLTISNAIEDLHKLRTQTPWELPGDIFFSPEVFYLENGDISVKGSLAPNKSKKEIIGMSFSIDTIFGDKDRRKGI